MREVIRVNKVEKKEKPVEFTACFSGYEGWLKSTTNPDEYEKVVYLGNCSVDGDMFACYNGKSIDIYKGHLNSGKY